MFLKEKTPTYHFSPSALQSPTYYNLASHLNTQKWRKARLAWLANFGERHFGFDLLACQQLEYKDLLAQLVTKFCPEIMPLTYCINDSNWPLVLNNLSESFYSRGSDETKDLQWILKPSLLNNGQHIKIFQRISDLEAHFIQSNRLGGNHVLQRYLSQPHLLKGPSLGHKHSLRLFIVLTNYAGAYLYPEGYFNVALKPYLAENFSDLSPHLTNEHLNDETLNVIQLPTEQIQIFKSLKIQIKSIVSAVIQGLQQMHPKAFQCPKERRLAIFGFDFMLDANEKLWLLEANHGPCFPTTPEHPLYFRVYHAFWQAFIASFVVPIAKHQPLKDIQYQLFEPISS